MNTDNNFLKDVYMLPDTTSTKKIKPTFEESKEVFYESVGSSTAEGVSSASAHKGEVFFSESYKPLTRVELIELCLQEARAYLKKNDPMQASEKLYKLAEETIKYLAEVNNLAEYINAQREGKWNTGRLQSAAPKLSKKLNKPEIAEGFTFAYNLHIEGFHENRIGVNEVKYYLPYIEKLVEYAREVDNARRQGNP